MVDDRIIQLIQDKDETGIELLKGKYGSMIHYIVMNILISEQDAEECVNDIYFQIWNKLYLYDKTKSKLSTWITAMSRNYALNYLKKKKNPTYEINENTISTPSPEDLLLKREKSVHISKAISCLSKSEKHLFYRKYYYLQSHIQIASELGLSARAVEGKLYRLRNKLKKILGSDLYE